MKANKYWKERYEKWVKEQIKDDEKLTETLRKHYDRTAKEMEKEIATYFTLYSEDDVIEYRTLMESLPARDKQLLIEDIAAFIEEYPEYEHLVPVRESIYKLNRLEGLHYSSQMKLLELGAIEQKELENHLIATYGKNFDKLAKELGVGSNFLSVNESFLMATIRSKWVNDEDFSDRIWANKKRLLNTLNNEIRDGIVRGDSYDKMSQLLVDRFNVGFNDAKRLVWTESSYVMNQAHAEPYIQLGVSDYEIVAILDDRTSVICREMDGEVFPFADMVVGTNYPPFHAYCRTVAIGANLDEILKG